MGKEVQMQTATVSAPADAPQTVSGRALVDIPEHGFKCGEYCSLPSELVEPLVLAGAFDPLVVEDPEAAE